MNVVSESLQTMMVVMLILSATLPSKHLLQVKMVGRQTGTQRLIPIAHKHTTQSQENQSLLHRGSVHGPWDAVPMGIHKDPPVELRRPSMPGTLHKSLLLASMTLLKSTSGPSILSGEPSSPSVHQAGLCGGTCSRSRSRHPEP